MFLLQSGIIPFSFCKDATHIGDKTPHCFTSLNKLQGSGKIIFHLISICCLE